MLTKHAASTVRWRLATNVHVLFQIVKKHHCLCATQRSVIANGSDSDNVFEIIPIFSQATRQSLAAACDTRIGTGNTGTYLQAKCFLTELLPNFLDHT